MRILITADIHCGIPGKLPDSIWCLKLIRNYAKEHNIQVVIILGDLFHDRVNLNIEVLSEVYDTLRTAKEEKQRWIIFPGNHDMFLKNSWKVNSLHILGDVIEVIEEVGPLVLDDTTFHIVPFIYYESVYMETINQIKAGKNDILLTHIGVNNATLNECFLIKNWSVVDLSKTNFKRVFTGHFHCHQECGKVIYPGSPIPFRFDEGVVDHGFLVYDTKTDVVEFIKSFEVCGNLEPKPPDFITITDDNLDKAANMVPGNNVRVILGKEYTTNQLSELKENVKGMGAVYVDWTLPESADKDISEEHETLTTDLKTPEAIFESWLKIDKPKLSTETLLAIHKTISQEAEERFVVEEEVLE